MYVHFYSFKKEIWGAKAPSAPLLTRAPEGGNALLTRRPASRYAVLPVAPAWQQNLLIYIYLHIVQGVFRDAPQPWTL